MTYREFMQQQHPEKCGKHYSGGCAGCPGDVVDGAPKEDDKGCLFDASQGLYGCSECWDMPMEQSAKKDPTE